MWSKDYSELIEAFNQFGFDRFHCVDDYNIIMYDILKNGSDLDVLVRNESKSNSDKYTVSYHAKMKGLSLVNSLDRRMAEKNLADLSRHVISQFKKLLAGNEPYLSVYKKSAFVWDSRQLNYNENDIILSSSISRQEILKVALSKNELTTTGIELLTYASATGRIMNACYAEIATAATGIQMYK